MDDSVAQLPLQTNIALQSARLDMLKRSSVDKAGVTANAEGMSDEKKASYAKAARGFESMFVHEMYKTMRESMLGKSDKEEQEENEMSFGNETLEGFTDLQFSDYVSQSGRGMGLAEMMYKHLTGEDHLPQMVTVHPLASANAGSLGSANAKSTGSTLSSAANASVSNEVTTADSASAFITRMNGKLGRFDSAIQNASEQFNVPQPLIKAIITAESAANPNAVSSVGAKGLMQLMNGTAKDLDVQNPFDPTQNILGGTEYIAKMIKHFGNLDHAVAAYNAGPGNVEKHGGIPPFAETQAYVRKVRRYMQEYKAIDNSSDIAATGVSMDMISQ